MRRQHVPASLRTLAPQLPESLADAIDKCLATDVIDRFETAARFVAAIERKYQVKIEDAELAQVTTLNASMALVQQKLGASASLQQAEFA